MASVIRVVRSAFSIVASALAVLLLPAVALGHGSASPPPSFPAVLLAWRLDPIPIAGVVLAAAAYGWAVRRAGRRHPAHRPSRRRTLAFMAGLVTILVALVSPIEAYEGQLFSVHMVQHMLLELIAAPLLLLGAPITLSLRAASTSGRRWLLGILQSRVVHVLSFPLIAWLLFAGVNWGWHFSALYNVALENPPLHYVQHATFLAAALLFWWPIVGLDPSPWRMAYPLRLFYLFLAMPQNSFLGVSLMSAGQALYPHYLAARSWGPSPLDDQNLGGTVMWVVGDMVFLVAMGLVVVAWARLEDRRTVRLDARLDAAEAAAARSAADGGS